MDKKRLKDLMYMIPDAYNTQIKQGKRNPISDGRYFDCDLYNYQSTPKEYDLEQDGYVYWKIMYSIGYENIYYDGDFGGGNVGYIGIPKWLYQYFLQGKSNFISWRQVQLIQY